MPAMVSRADAETRPDAVLHPLLKRGPDLDPVQSQAAAFAQSSEEFVLAREKRGKHLIRWRSLRRLERRRSRHTELRRRLQCPRQQLSPKVGFVRTLAEQALRTGRGEAVAPLRQEPARRQAQMFEAF